mmetsp:Transcript_14809/g.35287  ORF Transcript_14809/g.35287 Transcript_14809/m.35287 type:complete len:306 (+) Transcript_14809:51-968(+)
MNRCNQCHSPAPPLRMNGTLIHNGRPAGRLWRLSCDASRQPSICLSVCLLHLHDEHPPPTRRGDRLDADTAQQTFLAEAWLLLCGILGVHECVGQVVLVEDGTGSLHSDGMASGDGRGALHCALRRVYGHMSVADRNETVDGVAVFQPLEHDDSPQAIVSAPTVAVVIVHRRVSLQPVRQERTETFVPLVEVFANDHGLPHPLPRLLPAAVDEVPHQHGAEVGKRQRALYRPHGRILWVVAGPIHVVHAHLAELHDVESQSEDAVVAFSVAALQCHAPSPVRQLVSDDAVCRHGERQAVRRRGGA